MVYGNGMKAYSKKCDFLLSLATNTHICLDECHIENSFPEKPLGGTINKKFDFIEHAWNLCDKASEKINALARIFPFYNTWARKDIKECLFFCHNLGLIH